MLDKRAYRVGVILAIIVAAAFVAFFAVRTIRIRMEDEELMRNEAALLESVKAEKDRMAALESEKGRELTPEEMIELARQRYGLVFPNEILFLPDDR